MIGHTIGNYRIVERLGDGGMGSVYRAVDEMLDRDVAIKVLRPELARQAALVERFRQEAKALARLGHHRIATLHGLERHGDDLLMIMEYVRGDTLESIVHRSGRLAWWRAAELCAAVLDALDHAHDKQIVHRDIKPANVMLSHSGAVKVMDFGIARMLGKSRQTQFGHAVGTPTYMAPEQLRGEEVDRRTDLYAVGAVLFELITGRMAFEADSDYGLMMLQLNEPPPAPSGIVPDVPREIDRIIARAMAKQRDDRYPDAVSFAEDLEAVIAAHAATGKATPVPATRFGSSIAAPAAGETNDYALSGASVGATRLASDPSHAYAADTPETRFAGDASVSRPDVATRLAAAAHCAMDALPSWQRDWRTWTAVGALLFASGIAAIAMRGPAADDSARADSSAVAIAQDTLQLASATEEGRDPTVRSDDIPGFRGEDASSLILNRPAPSDPGRVAPGGEPGASGKPVPPTVRKPSEPVVQPSPSDVGAGKETPRDSSRAPDPPPQPKPVAPVPPAPRGQTEAEARAEIGSAITGAAAMLSGQSASTAEALLSGALREWWAALMLEGRISVSVDGQPATQIEGDNATAEFGATVNVRSPFGANRRHPARFTAQLERSGERWTVRSIRPVGSLDLK